MTTNATRKIRYGTNSALSNWIKVMIVWWTHSRMKAKFSPERIEELRFECPFMVGANYRNCWFGQRFTVNIRAHINHRVEPSDNTGECSYLLACFLRLEKFDKYVARILFKKHRSCCRRWTGYQCPCRFRCFRECS